MVRVYKRKTDRGKWSEINLKNALKVIEDGSTSVLAASRCFGIAEATLRRYRSKYPDMENLSSNGGRFKPTFSHAQQKQLYEFVIAVDRRAFGLTRIQLGRIAFAFAFAEKHKIPHQFKGMCAGRAWVEKFMQTFQLTSQTPENTSVARLMAFNKENVALFFRALMEVRMQYCFPACDIYNIDETGISTVPTKDPKTISPKGKRRVIKISSAERGINVTVVCGVNALGNYIPPVFIYPRVRDTSKYLVNPPKESIALGNDSCWMTNKLFLDYLKHYEYLYPRVIDLYERVIILPHTSASCKRVFSAVKIIKTDLRNHLGDMTMNSLLSSKNHLKLANKHCYNFVVPPGMLKKHTADMYKKSNPKPKS